MKNFLLLLTFVALSTPLFSQNNEYFLRVSARMHTAATKHVSIDASGKHALTVSIDKTAIFWDTKTGVPLRTFRPPIGDRNEGNLYAGALSPDGRIAALGGWTGYDWEGKMSIYLFDTSSGKMIQRIEGISDVILDLDFSPDGKYLAAGIGVRFGINVYRRSATDPKKYEYHTTIPGYSDSVFNIAFDRTGRLAAVSYDGKIRLYDSSFKLIAETAGAGRHPFSLSFSPDGKKIAVGYEDAVPVEVFSGKDLKPLYKPDTTGTTRQGSFLGGAVFSSDGKTLYAGGYYLKTENGVDLYLIRAWTKGGEGTFADYTAGTNTILDMKPMPDGSVIYCGFAPDFGIMKSDGKTTLYRPGPTVNLAANDKTHFKINMDGSRIAFAPLAKNPRIFSFEERTLVEQQPPADMRHYSDSTSDTIVTNWRNSFAPRVNNSPAGFLERYEQSRSVDISPDGKTLVFGADWYIYLTDSAGKTKIKIPAPGTSWAVKFSGNGKCFAAAFSNGTFGWYRVSDGKLLASVFTSADGEYWIAWTPKGFYSCSENNADDYIGWHLNQGINSEAMFFPASNFTSRMNRPDIVASVIRNCETDEEFLIRNGISVDDIGAQIREMISLSQMKDEKAAAGKPVGRIYSVDTVSGTIIVASARAGELVNIKDTLYVLIDGKKLSFEASFPMMTSVRCKAKKTLSADDIRKITKGMQVYK